MPPSEGRNKREERRLDTRLLTVADVEAIVAARLAEERGTVIPVLRQAIDELLDAEREHAKSEMAERARGLELQVAKLEAAVSALELALNVERNRVLDLLPLPKRAN